MLINTAGNTHAPQPIPTVDSPWHLGQKCYWIQRRQFIIPDGINTDLVVCTDNGHLGGYWVLDLNTSRASQDGGLFTDDILKCIFLNENVWIVLKISLKFVPSVHINNITALVQIMAWCRPGDKPLSEPMMISLLTHTFVTRPQWINASFPRRKWQKPYRYETFSWWIYLTECARIAAYKLKSKKIRLSRHRWWWHLITLLKGPPTWLRVATT